MFSLFFWDYEKMSCKHEIVRSQNNRVSEFLGSKACRQAENTQRRDVVSAINLSRRQVYEPAWNWRIGRTDRTMPRENKMYFQFADRLTRIL